MKQTQEGKLLIADSSSLEIEQLYGLLRDRYDLRFAQEADKAFELAIEEIRYCCFSAN